MLQEENEKEEDQQKDGMTTSKRSVIQNRLVTTSLIFDGGDG